MGRRSWDETEARLIEAITEHGVLNYAKVAVILDVMPSTASIYCKKLSEKYPENVEYHRGVLYLKKPFFEEDIDPEVRIKILKQNIIAQERIKEEIANKLQKIISNHLPHGEYEKTLNELKQLLMKLRKT